MWFGVTRGWQPKHDFVNPARWCKLLSASAPKPFD
jgi:hypothetical protein